VSLGKFATVLRGNDVAYMLSVYALLGIRPVAQSCLSTGVQELCSCTLAGIPLEKASRRSSSLYEDNELMEPGLSIWPDISLVRGNLLVEAFAIVGLPDTTLFNSGWPPSFSGGTNAEV